MHCARAVDDRIRKLILISIALAFFESTFTFAIDTLPYATRTHSYNGWSTTPQGDLRTVGMAGATIGLADSFMAASGNPAGLAMTLKDGDSTFSSNSFQDGNKQSFDSIMSANNVGAA